MTGIQASIYAKLRQSLSLKDKLVRIADPFQMLGEIDMKEWLVKQDQLFKGKEGSISTEI